MFAIMDMEWRTEGEVTEITQLAAMMVDSSLNIIETLYTRIRPQGLLGDQWFHPSYNGGSRKEFCKAPEWKEVKKLIPTWFHMDDVLLWWHSEAMNQFRRSFYEKGSPCPKMIVISKTVKNLFSDHLAKKGNPYRLAQIRGIETPSEEHYSINDVQVICNLLKALNVNPDMLLNPSERPKETAIHQQSTAPLYPNAAKLSTFPFVLDQRLNIYHKNGCPRILYSNPLKGFGTLKGCRKQQAKPCQLCINGDFERIEAPGFYGSMHSTRRIFHCRACSILQRISPANLVHYSSLDEAYQAGWNFCKKCNPLLALYKQEYDELVELCRQKQIQIDCQDESVAVYSRHDIWRIVVNSDGNRIILMHRNKHYYRCNGNVMGNYHQQEHQEKSLAGYIRYIANHDDYVDQQFSNPIIVVPRNSGDKRPFKKSKKGRKENELTRRTQHKREIARVLALIDELAARQE